MKKLQKKTRYELNHLGHRLIIMKKSKNVEERQRIYRNRRLGDSKREKIKRDKK